MAIALAILLTRKIDRGIQLVVRCSRAIGDSADTSTEAPSIRETAELLAQVELAHRRVRDALDQAAWASAANDEFLAVLGHEPATPSLRSPTCCRSWT